MVIAAISTISGHSSPTREMLQALDSIPIQSCHSRKKSIPNTTDTTELTERKPLGIKVAIVLQLRSSKYRENNSLASTWTCARVY